jgi:CRP-like cAMP-binding protein
MDRLEIEEVLKASDLFRGLEKEDIERIAGLCRMKTYKTGEYLFRQGDFGDNLYVIAEGHVFLERATDLGTRKGGVIIAMLGKGRAFGCWSTLLDEPHNLMSSATCQKPTKVLVMNGEDLRQMMLENSRLGFRVLERLCFLLRDRIQGAYGAMEKV